MSQDRIVEDTKRRLGELEQRINAAKSLAAPRDIAVEARKDWDAMVRTHAEISRRLTADQSSEILEGVRLDIDVLRNSFERWMTRVEGGFAQRRKR